MVIARVSQDSLAETPIGCEKPPKLFGVSRMGTSPVVSVVIPAYNAGAYVHAAIESCLRQSLVDIEVLVVDDGSIDDTASVVRRCTSDSRVRLIELGVNRGVSAARNAALGHATGVWIANLDADDSMTDDRLSVLVAAATRTGADLLHDDLFLVREGDTDPYATLTESTGSPVSVISSVDLNRLIDCEVGGSSRYRLGLTRPIFRRAFIEAHNIRFDPTVRVGEDYLFYLECVLAGATWLQIPSAHYRYLQRAGSATSASQVSTLEAKLRTCTRVLARPTLRPSERASLSRYQCNLVSLLAYQRVVEPAKAGDVGRAFGAAFRNPRFMPRLCREIPEVLRRRWALYVRHDTHALDMLPSPSASTAKPARSDVDRMKIATSLGVPTAR